LSLILSLVGFLACFVILAIASHWFIDGLSTLSHRYKIPQSVAGATIAAIGSSAPEFFSNGSAVILEVPNVGIGVITGSAIFNILVIVGLSAMFGPCKVLPRVVTRDGLFYVLALFSFIWVIWDRNITWLEAIFLVLCYGFYFAILLRDIKRHPEGTPFADLGGEGMALGRAFVVVPSCILVFGITCHFLIQLTLDLGKSFQINPVIIGLLVNAIGTSIPDTFASIAAVRKGLGSLAISNVVGSNIFDIWFCIGVPLAFRASTPVVGEIAASVPFLLVSVVVAMVFIRSDWQVTKTEGAILLAMYGGFVGYIMYTAFN